MYNRSADKSRGDTAIKVVLLVIIIAIMAGASVYFLSDLIGHEDPVIQDPGPVPGNEPGPAPGDDPDPGAGDEPGHIPEPDDDIAVTVVKEEIAIINIAEINNDLWAALDEESASHNCAGVSLVVYDGFTDLYYTYQYGSADRAAERPVNADTKIRIASLSKFVVVLCAMKLVDDGLLDLDADISDYLGYEVKNPGFPDTAITSRMLMQHTSTIYDTSAFHDSISGSAWVPTRNLLTRSSSYWDRKPGTAFEYSNFGYSILGAVIEMVSGKKLDTYAREVLFDPLDIDASFLAVNLRDTGNIATLYDTDHRVARSVDTQLANSRSGDLGEDQHLAQGSLFISALDYAKILAMLGNGGVFQNERILSPDAVVEIHRADFSGPAYKQGLSTRFTHGGSAGDDSGESNRDIVIWQYINHDDLQVPNDGFYWHTGSAYGVYAQYIYIAGSGTDTGVGGPYSSRGVVVITTGASSGRAPSGMINVCTHLSSIAWSGLGFDKQ